MDFLRSHGIVPLTRPVWERGLTYFRGGWIALPIQLAVDYYPMGKTSYVTRLNVPGKPAWMAMELVAPVAVVYTMLTVSATTHAALPTTHVWLAFLFCVHYAYRAVLSTLRNPGIAPYHVSILCSGICFNLVNGSLIGGWLGGYGSAEAVPAWQVLLGSVVFLLGFAGNVFHEEILYDLRRGAGGHNKEGKAGEEEEEEGVVRLDGRVYKIPYGGLFKYVWYPHYLCEWFEWSGFILAGGGAANFAPATTCLLNELATMVPRALQGKRWYKAKFGARAPERKAAFPGLL